MPATGDVASQTRELDRVSVERRRRGPAYLIAAVVVAVCVGGAIWLWDDLRHPTAFSDIGYGAVVPVTVGTTVTFPLTPDPWGGGHGTLHVHAIYPRLDGPLPHGATVSVWRCVRTDVGSPGGWAAGEQPIQRACQGAQRITGSFDLDATRGSREALLLAVTSSRPARVRFTGVVVRYREGLHWGQQVIDVDGQVSFTPRQP